MTSTFQGVVRFAVVLSREESCFGGGVLNRPVRNFLLWILCLVRRAWTDRPRSREGQFRCRGRPLMSKCFFVVMLHKVREYAGPWEHTEHSMVFQQDNFVPSLSVRSQPFALHPPSLRISPCSPQPPSLQWAHSREPREEPHWTPQLGFFASPKRHTHANMVGKRSSLLKWLMWLPVTHRWGLFQASRPGSSWWPCLCGFTETKLLWVAKN